jgi:hypothetical protein
VASVDTFKKGTVMFRRNDANTPQQQDQHTHDDSSHEGGNTRGDSSRSKRYTFTVWKRGTGEQPAETLARGSGKSAEKQPEDSSNLSPIEHKSSWQSNEASSQPESPLDPSQLYKPGLNLASKTFSVRDNKTSSEGLATLTNQQLNNKEANLEKNVERSTDLSARHKAKKEIRDIHEQKRENKREYFKGGLRKTYKQLIESMITVVTEDVKTTKEPKVHSKILKSDEAAKVVAEKRDKDKEKSTTHNRYAKLNSNSLFRSGIEQSLSRQPEFYEIERIILKQPKTRTQEVRSKLQDIRSRFDTDKTHLRAHGIVDIEAGTIKLNGSNDVIHLASIKSITANPSSTSIATPHIAIEGDSPHDELYASSSHSPVQPESSFSPRPRLRVSTTGNTLSPSDALLRDSDTTSSPGKEARSHKRRDSDAISFHGELPTHGSADKSWTITLSDNKTVLVKNENTQSLLKTQHRINFQTGRIELGNGTIIDFKDIDWEKTAEKTAKGGDSKPGPTLLQLKQESSLYKDGSTIDLKEASRSLDAAAAVNRQKYEHALKQYSLTQMALLEKVAYAGSSSLSDMHALLAGIRTNESALIKVQEGIFQLKRAEDSVTAYDFKEEVRRIGNEATKGLLHIRQIALNKASQAYAWALKSSAYADIRKEQGRFGQFGETDTVKTIKGLHKGPGHGIELQNDRDLPKYDRLKAEEPEFLAQKTSLEAQRDELAVQLEHLNRQVKPLDMQDADLKNESARLHQEDAPRGEQEAVMGQQKTTATRQSEILKQREDIRKNRHWIERESIRGQHDALVAQCAKQDRKAADFKALEDQLATSKSPYTRNSYFIRKIAEADALGQLDHVATYVNALQRVNIDHSDNALVKARKEYENARVDHIKRAAAGEDKEDKNPDELRMALYEERYHASIVRYNTNRAKYALENKVSWTEISSEGKEIVKDEPINRLKAVRKMHLEDIITDPSKLTGEQEAAQQKSQRSYDATMYRVKPAEFVPRKTEMKSATDNAADFTVYARERARYEVQKLIDKTADVNDKAKMIDNRGDLEKDFVDRFTKTYGEERTRAHEFERVKMARKTMNDFAKKQLWLSLLMNTQMAYNSFDQSVDTTMNSIIRSTTRTA